MDEKYVVLSRDPFGRYEIVRRKAADGACAWCGNTGRRWNYGWEPDGIRTQPHWEEESFCGKGCRDAYYG